MSIWRYSHLSLAVSSFLFILLASITGIILAFEPISEQVKPYKAESFETITVAETMLMIAENYDEVIDLTIDANGFVLIDAIDLEGEMIQGYIDPKTGDFLGNKIEKSKLFQFTTTLHRSLFLKSTGRFFVGLCSFLLFLIAVSGSILIIKRQSTFKRFFSKIIKENFAQYYHIVLGRLFLIPIIIITITGVYLSFLRFDLLPSDTVKHQPIETTTKGDTRINSSDFELFKKTQLSDVRSIEFPFSDDVEDYYTLKLKDKEYLINQYTGAIHSQKDYPLIHLVSVASINLHTGSGSITWSIVLLIACINILFFIYSGFKMTLERRASKFKNPWKKDQAEIVVLVGSENGSTKKYAAAFHEQLLANKQKSYITDLNRYTSYKKAKKLIVITATYGVGEPPANASNFLQKLETIDQVNPIEFSVVGFGSMSYPNFCEFASVVDAVLNKKPGFNRQTALVKINDKSFETFHQWLDEWAACNDLPLSVSKTNLVTKPLKTHSYTVVETKGIEENPDQTFLIKLQPNSKQKIKSGDLLAIYPANDERERLYSIGKIDDNLQLSIKLHPKGLGSSYLHKLSVGSTIKARIIKNYSFYFPKKSSAVILIANGTGVAPFLGMLHQNVRQNPTHLYLGLRHANSIDIYKEQLQEALDNKKLSQLHLAQSKADDSCYVQDLILRDEAYIAAVLRDRGTIMICGSLNMQKGVMKALDNLSRQYNKKPISDYSNQLKSDCY